MSFHTPYTKWNFLSFALACFCTISYVVFLSSTQSFYLTDVLGVTEKIGDYIGTLGFADELLSISLSPFLGALSDKIGPKYISAFGVFIIGVSLMLYTTAKSVYPGLLIWRLLFALGATAGAGMLTALLAELSASGFELQSLFTFNEPVRDHEALQQEAVEHVDAVNRDEALEDGDEDQIDGASFKRNGKLTSVIGIASGLGAVFSVSVYLPLPTKLGKIEPPAQALKHSYLIVGGIAIVSSFFLVYGLFSNKKLRIPWLSRYLSPYDDVLEELEAEERETARQTTKSYFELLRLGFAEARNLKIALAYLGGFVSRSTTVVTAVFIPLYVNSYYLKSGQCSTGDRYHCRDAYVLAAILTGIIHSLSLVLAPVFGYIADKYGRKNSMLITATSGIIGSCGFAFLRNPTSTWAYVFCLFLGTSQIGSIITSMSLATDKHRAHNGAISGVYSFVGGIGILLISKIGGLSADHWAGAPFIILALFDTFLLMATLYAGGKFTFLKRKLTSVALETDE